MKTQQSKTLFDKAQQYLVGGVNSPVRAFKSVGGTPIFIEKGNGSKIFDVDGNAYVDFVQAYGPMILGHNNETVTKQVTSALQDGYAFGATNEKEVQLAQIVCETFETIDKVRFVNSGTEAVFSAIRLARAYTGKDKIIKFSGCYHGHADTLLVAAGSGLATFNMPSSDGVPQDAVKHTLIAEYNNIESVKTVIENNKGQIAALIIEPIAGNMGCVLPSPQFIQALQQVAKGNQILIIVDEVMTGFRSKFGGAQDLIGLKADITTFGKIIGGGFPVGAYGARDEIMQKVAPLGNMYQAGTLSGNPISMACGIATLQTLQQSNPYPQFEKHGAFLEKAFYESAEKYGVSVQVNRFGSMLTPFFTAEKVVDFTSASKANTEQFSTFFWAMMEKGIFLPPSQFESWFLSAVMTDEDLEQTKLAIDYAMEQVAKAHF
ncbi:Glutamate-1-semialdehyde 2,1-aminomutase 2 [Phocoenobacter uteri]|uniref:Glutamate-1-semialdehyde 2,1-aminomutase n=1 Tax=Phocoenobacter uteri TaxID=146806 RepID=A0A379C7S5_9PAST|nr:glutamate-1-semialdehyde 2,1-aminomutase [Phocoenobacter uteri]MDG6882275.1 glutamate-1-semialdehyde aminotransferase [Phocoenobacter uteri]SUB58432.1 Glutamate-1-semialdehyde 2,1-aminomutase 2 [Phocoenobacter uteri]